jgi:hypothetical protein
MKKTFKILLFITMSWLFISNIIQALKCSEMTQTELFLHLPKSFICDFKNCENE